MFFKNRTYICWWGPIVGAVTGFELALDHANSRQPHEFVLNLCLCTGLGFASGFLVMLVDPSPAAKGISTEKRASPTLAGNVLCALSFLFFFIPLVGIVLAGLALACNWKVGGWPRRLSWLGLAVGIVYAHIFVRLSMHYHPEQWGPIYHHILHLFAPKL